MVVVVLEGSEVVSGHVFFHVEEVGLQQEWAMKPTFMEIQMKRDWWHSHPSSCCPKPTIQPCPSCGFPLACTSSNQVSVTGNQRSWLMNLSPRMINQLTEIYFRNNLQGNTFVIWIYAELPRNPTYCCLICLNWPFLRWNCQLWANRS